MMFVARYLRRTFLVLLLAGCASQGDERASASAAGAPPDAATPQTQTVVGKAGEIVTQPARDLRVVDTKIPPVLRIAAQGPYSLAGLADCTQLATAIRELNAVLGPDYLLPTEKRENKAGKVAEAGAKTIVNAFIPFRGLVRELTGAAAAKRRLEDAINAGYARRGFLRGIQTSKGCPTSL